MSKSTNSSKKSNETCTEEMERSNSKQRGRRGNRNGKKKNNAGSSIQGQNPALSKKGRDNDPNWYFLDSGLANQAAAFSFDQFLGVETDMVRVSSKVTGTNAKYAKMAVPAIISARMSPSVGDTSSMQRGINLAGLRIYSELSAVNAKTTQYGPQDIIILLCAMGQLIAIMEHVRRAFGVAFTYNQRNRVLPKKLLYHMGLNPDTFLKSMANKRLEFNSLVTSVNQIPFLSNISYLWKCGTIYSKVYADSTSAMAQVMMMVPGTTWVLDEITSDTGSILKATGVPNEGSEWEEWVTLIQKMIDALLQSATLNYMYADILNYSSKKGAKLMYMDYLQEGYVVVPEYNRNFSLQFHNMVVIGPAIDATTDDPDSKPDNSVYANANINGVEYDPRFMIDAGLESCIIDSDLPEMDVVDRIEATRFQATTHYMGQLSGSSRGYGKATSLPDHYCNRMTIDDGVNGPTNIQTVNMVDTSTDGGWPVDAVAVTQFDWGPLVYVVESDSTGENNQLKLIGDVNYYTVLDDAWYNRVNDLGYIALFTLR